MLIVGLGNPGKKYEDTVHNMGFMTVDVLLDKLGARLDKKGCEAEYCVQYIGGEKHIIAKPQTYMNLSGECVREIVDYYKVDEKPRLIVIYDDVSMDVGRLRIRKKGSAGGHNGIKNIILHLGHDVFQRIKIGVGEKPESYDLADYVLGHFTSEEVKKIKESAVLANEAVRLIVWDETEAAMNRFN